MENNNPFKTLNEKKIEEQSKEQVKITKEELMSDFESLKEPYSNVKKPGVQRIRVGGPTMYAVMYDVLTNKIQEVTNELEKITDDTTQRKMQSIKEKIDSIKIRLDAISKSEEHFPSLL